MRLPHFSREMFSNRAFTGRPAGRPFLFAGVGAALSNSINIFVFNGDQFIFFVRRAAQIAHLEKQ